jgi:hypothetical protein
VLTLRHLTGERRGQEDRFDSARISIGRGVNNHCAFDPQVERSVSHRHCELRVEGEELVIYDIGSLNGTYLNGRRIRRSAIRDGDEIGLGREGPRMRVAFHSGRTPGPIAPGDLGGLPLPRTYDAPSKRKLPIVLIAIAIVAVAVAAVFMLVQLQERMARLESEKGSSSSMQEGIDGSLAVQLPKDAPTGPRGATTLLLGVTRDGEGRTIATRELGGGCLVDEEHALTTRENFLRAREFVTSVPAGMVGHIALRIAGRTDCEIPVRSGRAAATDDNSPDSRLALLRLGGSGAIPYAVLGTPKMGSAEWYPPGQVDRRGAVLSGRDLRGRVSVLSEAPFFEVEDLSGPAGLPVFQGERLVGLIVDRSGPTRAITASVMERFLLSSRSLPSTTLSRADDTNSK